MRINKQHAIKYSIAIISAIITYSTIRVLGENYITDSRKTKISKRFEEAVKSLKPQLPKRLDNATTIIDLKSDGLNLTYLYKLHLKKAEIDINLLNQHLEKLICTNIDTNNLVKEGAGFTYEYIENDNNDEIVAKITINSCP